MKYSERWLAAMKKVWKAEAEAGGASVAADRAKGMPRHPELEQRAVLLAADAKRLRADADRIRKEDS